MFWKLFDKRTLIFHAGFCIYHQLYFIYNKVLIYYITFYKLLFYNILQWYSCIKSTSLWFLFFRLTHKLVRPIWLYQLFRLNLSVLICLQQELIKYLSYFCDPFNLFKSSWIHCFIFVLECYFFSVTIEYDLNSLVYSWFSLNFIGFYYHKFS